MCELCPHSLKAAQIKKEKDAAKKVIRRERKLFRSLCKTHGYYGEGEVVAGRMEQLESLCDSLPVEQLQALNEKLRDGRGEESRVAIEEAVSWFLWEGL